MRKILITGAYGFIGQSIAKYFSGKPEYELSALDIIHPDNDWYARDFYWDDTDKIDWNHHNTIIHLAGLAHDTGNTSNPDDYFKINVGLTQKVFDYFKLSNCKNLIFFSSVKAVADVLHDGILTEDSSPNPKTPYGQSKLEAEKYLLNQKIPNGKGVFILRPCMIHGPGNKGNLNLLYRFIKIGIPYPLGAFENKRSFTSIANLNYILEKIIEGRVSPGIYNISDNETLSTIEIITYISGVLHKKVRILRINQKFVRRIARLGDFLHLPFNSERLLKLTQNYTVSNNRLISELGTSLPVSAVEGLVSTIKSFDK